MKTKDAIELAGSAAVLSEMLEITPSAISQWGEDVPDARIWQLKVICPKWFAKVKPWSGIERRAGTADRRSGKAV